MVTVQITGMSDNFTRATYYTKIVENSEMVPIYINTTENGEPPWQKIHHGVIKIGFCGQ